MAYYVLPSPSLKEWLFSFVGLRTRMRVKGESMLPTLKAGDLVLVSKYAYQNDRPEINDVVVAWHPQEENLSIIKRVSKITREGQVTLHSDNPRGKDSRHFGTLELNQIIGKVVGHSAAEQNSK